jgi:hypothetical protein
MIAREHLDKNEEPSIWKRCARWLAVRTRASLIWMEPCTSTTASALPSAATRTRETSGVAGDLARQIKIADLEDNLARSEGAGLVNRVDKYRQALASIDTRFAPGA